MLTRIARWLSVPLTLAMASAMVWAPPSGAVTGKNIAPDFEHEYVGLVAFYDSDGVFLHRCTRDAAVLRGVPDRRALRGRRGRRQRRRVGAHLVRAGRRRRLRPGDRHPGLLRLPRLGGVTSDACSTTTGSPTSSTIPETHDVGLIVLDPGAVETEYPEIDTYGELAPVGAADALGTGIDAVVTVSGYGVTRINGKNGHHTVSFRERLMGQTFIINTRNKDTAGYNLQLASNSGGGRVGTCFGDSGGPVFAGDSNDGAGGQLVGEELELWRPGLLIPRRHRRGAGLDGVRPGAAGPLDGGGTRVAPVGDAARPAGRPGRRDQCPVSPSGPLERWT